MRALHLRPGAAARRRPGPAPAPESGPGEPCLSRGHSRLNPQPDAPEPGDPESPAPTTGPGTLLPSAGASRASPAPGAPPTPVRPRPEPPAARAAGSTHQGSRVAHQVRKDLRQSSTRTLLLLAVQYMANRCEEQDILAGNDDPNLPLVSCSSDHKYVSPSRTSRSSAAIRSRTPALALISRAAYVVDLEFKDQAATTWADFTAANVGTQTAFTLDLAGGQRTADSRGDTRRPQFQISGGNPPFDSARQLANVPGTVHCRCRSSRPRPKRCRRRWD